MRELAMNQAQLITPEGKTIVLPEHVYFRVIKILEEEKPPRKWTREEIEEIIMRTRGSWKVEGKKPLTQVLLKSRREEFDREERRIRERQKRLAARRKRAA